MAAREGERRREARAREEEVVKGALHVLGDEHTRPRLLVVARSQQQDDVRVAQVAGHGRTRRGSEGGRGKQVKWLEVAGRMVEDMVPVRCPPPHSRPVPPCAGQLMTTGNGFLGEPASHKANERAGEGIGLAKEEGRCEGATRREDGQARWRRAATVRPLGDRVRRRTAGWRTRGGTRRGARDCSGHSRGA